MNTVLVVNATIGFSENLLLVIYVIVLAFTDTKKKAAKVEILHKIRIFCNFRGFYDNLSYHL